MHKKFLILGFMVPWMLVGCASTVKSPNEPMEQAAKQPSKQDELLQPSVDHMRAARLYIELGLSYLKQGQVGRAKVKLLRAQKLAPTLPEVHYAMGFYKEAIGEYSQADKHFNEAIKQDPKAGEAHNNYGTFLCRQKQFHAAEQQFLQAVEDVNYAQISEALENAGLCVLQIPDVAKATTYFERAARMDSRRVEAIIELGYIKFNQGSYGEAMEYHSLYEAQAEPTPRSLWLGIKIAEVFKDKDKAASLRMLLKNKYPQSAEAIMLINDAISNG